MILLLAFISQSLLLKEKTNLYLFLLLLYSISSCPPRYLFWAALLQCYIKQSDT